MDIHPFISWLDGQLQSRNWSDRQLVREARISHNVISKARAGTPPGWAVCSKLADTFNVPRESVFRAAGLLPAIPESDSNLEDIVFCYGQLRPQYQDLAQSLVRALLKFNP